MRATTVSCERRTLRSWSSEGVRMLPVASCRRSFAPRVARQAAGRARTTSLGQSSRPCGLSSHAAPSSFMHYKTRTYSATMTAPQRSSLHCTAASTEMPVRRDLRALATASSKSGAKSTAATTNNNKNADATDEKPFYGMDPLSPGNSSFISCCCSRYFQPLTHFSFCRGAGIAGTTRSDV